MINGIEKKNISVKELKKDGRYLNAALYTPKTEPGKTYPLVLVFTRRGRARGRFKFGARFHAGRGHIYDGRVAGGAPVLCPRAAVPGKPVLGAVC